MFEILSICFSDPSWSHDIEGKIVKALASHSQHFVVFGRFACLFTSLVRDLRSLYVMII
jgi:hypothetical protein